MHTSIDENSIVLLIDVHVQYTEARNPACSLVTATPLDCRKCDVQSHEETVLQKIMNTSVGWSQIIVSSLSVCVCVCV